MALFERFLEPRYNADAVVNSRLEPLDNVDAVVSSRVQAPAEQLVHRDALMRELHEWNALEPSLTLVLHGPRGSGKSTAVLEALAGQAGVLQVELTPENDNLACAIVRELALTKENRPHPCTTLDELQPVFTAARARMPNGTWPVVVVEESGVGKAAEVLAQNALRQVKNLLFDYQMARGVLVLSDATLVFALNEDHARRLVVWVDDFTRAEADTFLDKHGVLTGVNDTRLRAQLFDAAGTRPAQLLRFVDSYHRSPQESTVRAFIRTVREEACSLMQDWKLGAKPAHSLLHRLAESANGVAALENEQGEAEIIKEELLRLIKQRGHLVLYHRRLVRAYSPAHLRAIRQWHMSLPCEDEEE